MLFRRIAIIALGLMLGMAAGATIQAHAGPPGGEGTVVAEGNAAAVVADWARQHEEELQAWEPGKLRELLTEPLDVDNGDEDAPTPCSGDCHEEERSLGGALYQVNLPTGQDLWVTAPDRQRAAEWGALLGDLPTHDEEARFDIQVAPAGAAIYSTFSVEYNPQCLGWTATALD